MRRKEVSILNPFFAAPPPSTWWKLSGFLGSSLEHESWAQIKDQMYSKNWIIYAQKPIGGVNGVLDYLGRYAHRVAITNSRISEMSKDQVSFRYQDNKDHGVNKTMTLQAVEFIRRFMMHVLPDNFYKIRYYGIMAAVNTKTIREQCQVLDYLPEYPPSIQITGYRNEFFEIYLFINRSSDCNGIIMLQW